MGKRRGGGRRSRERRRRLRGKWRVLRRIVVAVVIPVAVVAGPWSASDVPSGLAVKLASRELGDAAPHLEPGRAIFGVATPSGPYNLTELDAFQKAAGKKPSLLMFHEGWERGTFDMNLLSRIDRRGMLPMITWEPWDYEAPSAPTSEDQKSKYALSNIANGSFDGYLREWAVEIRRWSRPVAIRFAHEMNGSWYPWGESVNGNRPGDYVAAWRHVWNIFRDAGAANVIWVWSPNVIFPGSTPLEGLYPGDEYVNWIGIDGYNGGAAVDWGGWVTFEDLFGPTMKEIRSFTLKPIMLAEVGAAEAGGSKAAWIADFFDSLERHPDIIGFVWFEARKQADWRIETSEESRAAFAARVADRRYG